MWYNTAGKIKGWNVMDKKDEIITRQTEIIRSMTEQNLRRVGADLWSSMPSGQQTGKDAPAKPIPQNPSAEKREKTEMDVPEREDIEMLQKELDGYIGLENIKKEVRNLINVAQIYQKRRENGLPTADMSLHMVFSGNPGTGKTMIARLMARVYHSLGILSKGQLVEVDRSGLVAGYVGQTAIKTSKMLEKAAGGVLFVDEAYTLISGSENDFGQEAVDTILKAMEDNRDDLIVIVAGYTDLMHDFIESNPGLRSRFNRYLEFTDYSPEEMLEIFRVNCKKSSYDPEETAQEKLLEYFRKMTVMQRRAFGNARGVRNVFERILSCQADRLAEMDSVTKKDLMQILEQDVTAVVEHA